MADSNKNMEEKAEKTPKAKSSKDPEGDGREEADESENESAKSLDYEHSKEGVPRDDSKTEDPTKVEIDDMLLQCDVAHFAAILKSEDILTVDDAVEALSDMTGDWIRQMGETARLAADALTLKGKRALSEHAAKVAAEGSQENEGDSAKFWHDELQARSSQQKGRGFGMKSPGRLNTPWYA
ncbi:unnamed protein product [Symbiodinium necroappetens]|uniref:Uncharacterized protein n=1 Tax=Symbiodinium necroappetens TaxID=1628268 RepID=A0A812VA53_9DINO|nr:unnamed protein product [Symbiodinium necroappetens]